MTTGARRLQTLRTVAAAASVTTVSVGALALVGWASGSDVLKGVVPGLVAMNPATAVLFVLAGASLWLLRIEPPRAAGARTAAALAALLALGGAWHVLCDLFGWTARYDRLLFAAALGENRMAPNTALHFVLAGSALLLLERSTRRGVPLAQIPALVMLAGSALALVGYLFGAVPLYGVPSFIPMALNTAALFALLAVGLLAARPGRGVMVLLTSHAAGGLMVRRLVPVALIIPLILGWLRLEGQQAGLYGTEFGTSLVVAASMGVFLAAIWWTGRAIDRADRAREQAEGDLRRAHDALELRVQDRTAELLAANRKLEAEIAERNRAVEAERASEQRFRLLVEGVSDYAILLLDRDGLVASWNAGAERIKGYRATEIIGRHFSVFYPAEDRTGGQPEHELAVAARDGRFEEEGWRVRRDGSRFWANVVLTPLRDDLGEVCGFAKITRDVTERREAQQRIERLNAELAGQLARLAEANRDLDHKSRENEMFVYSVSHDLRSPLVNLQGFSQELELACRDLRELVCGPDCPAGLRSRAMSLIDENVAEAIRFIQSGVLRLSGIIDSLLRLSRAGRVEYRIERLDVSEIVARVVESLSVSISDHGAEVSVRELPPAHGDASAIEQVFANLIGNALKYLDPARPGEIEIGAIADRDTAHSTYYVRDNGLGIDAAYHEKIFQAFQRVHPEAAPGDGMGLAIIRRAVERHGGRVWVESTAGVGSTFYIALPGEPPQTTTASDSLPRRSERQEQLA